MGERVTTEREIQALVYRETAAGDRQDPKELVSLFHHNLVWPWPPDAKAHDPALWVFPHGRYNRQRWKAAWEELFRTHEVIHSIRKTVRIAISDQGDGAFAVVDVDTLWRRRSDLTPLLWKGRACKGYTKVGDNWVLIFHTGLLDYDAL